VLVKDSNALLISSCCVEEFVEPTIVIEELSASIKVVLMFISSTRTFSVGVCALRASAMVLSCDKDALLTLPIADTSSAAAITIHPDNAYALEVAHGVTIAVPVKCEAHVAVTLKVCEMSSSVSMTT
jgi:hypothetical protein